MNECECVSLSSNSAKWKKISKVRIRMSKRRRRALKERRKENMRSFHFGLFLFLSLFLSFFAPWKSVVWAAKMEHPPPPPQPPTETPSKKTAVEESRELSPRRRTEQSRHCCLKWESVFCIVFRFMQFDVSCFLAPDIIDNLTSRPFNVIIVPVFLAFSFFDRVKLCINVKWVERWKKCNS